MFKVGEYIQYQYQMQNGYIIGKIEKIEDGKLWCHWSVSGSTKRYPKTKNECDKIINYYGGLSFLKIERDKDRIEKLEFNINKRIS